MATPTPQDCTELTTLPPNRRAPSHRHAIPSGPWPWIDIDHPVPLECQTTTVKSWPGYPQALYQNWMPGQIKSSNIQQVIDESWKKCTIYSMGVNADGKFMRHDPQAYTPRNQLRLWEYLQSKREEGVRLRVLFVDSMSGPVLQMLGTTYNIEPFFFSSALNWIPGKYQEQAKDGEGDHITISLTFIRAITEDKSQLNEESSLKIDVRGDLILRNPKNCGKAPGKRLVVDLLAIHMVRTPENSTLITYHPPQGTDAKTLHDRLYFAGESVYWSYLYAQATDPTFVLVATLWYALYAWDQALEVLYEHICSLEETVIGQNDFKLTQELHLIRAHLLHYESLLENFKQSVEFIRDTPNCALAPDASLEKSQELLKKECNILIAQLIRLEKDRQMQDMRLRNVTNLVFSHINIQETRVAVRDSAIMKQIAFLTMVFLPATWVAGIFGMNVKEINPGSLGTLPHYVATIIPLTAVTFWIVVAVQIKYLSDKPDDVSVWSQLWWPLTSAHQLLRRLRRPRLSQKEKQMMAADIV